MQSDKGAPAIFFRKHFPLIEDEAQDRGMRLNQNIAGNRLFDEIESLTFAPGIFVWAIVSIGPAVKAAIFDLSNEIRRQIVAHAIALLHRGPERPRPRKPGKPNRAARAAGVGSFPAAVGIELKNRRAHPIGLHTAV